MRGVTPYLKVFPYLPKKAKKKESHFGDSPDHQGASTRHNITRRGEGCHPLFKSFSLLTEKKQKKGEPLQRLSRSSGCIYLSQYTALGMGGNAPNILFSVKVEAEFIK